MSSGESAQRARPVEISAWDIKQARRLVELSQNEQLPSLLAERDLLSCLYYPLQQVALPQFQSEMLLWDSDKLNVFSATENAELSLVHVTNGILLNPAVLYKRADDFTVLALVYSLESQMAAVFTNEISQTSWEIVGVFSSRDLEKLISSNLGQLHSYDTYEEAYERAKNTGSSDSPGVRESDEDSTYWNRYDKELDSNEPEPSAEPKKSEEEYWQMYDKVPDEEGGANLDTAQQVAVRGGSTECSLATKILLDLAPLYEDCGLDAAKFGTTLRRAAVPDDQVIEAFAPAHQIAWNHTKRTVTLVREHFGETACEQAVKEAVQTVERH